MAPAGILIHEALHCAPPWLNGEACRIHGQGFHEDGGPWAQSLGETPVMEHADMRGLDILLLVFYLLPFVAHLLGHLRAYARTTPARS